MRISLLRASFAPIAHLLLATRAPPVKLVAESPPLIDRALLAARACSLAFVPPDAIAASAYATDGAVKLSCVGQVEDQQTLCGATVLTASTGEVIVACRGSSSVKSFQTNLNIGPVPLMTSRGAHPTARVHAGFQATSKELFSQLKPILRVAFQRFKPWTG